MSPDALLSAEDPASYRVENPNARSPFVLTCDHAGNALPRRLGCLGLSARELSSHIAWDLGVEGLGRKLAQQLDAFLILQTYSRLVIDANRPPGSAESIVARSERTDIPGNAQLRASEVEQRAAAVFWPYHDRLRSELDRRLAAGAPTVLVALHSFTPVFKGVPRPWHIGVLYGRDARLGRALLERLRADPTLEVGDNEPYAVSDETDYTLLVHGEQRGLLNVELELRQDLIESEADQQAWASRLSELLIRIMLSLFPT